ncbi:MAG: histidinol-phosphate transaminase [Lachnospiraceae bacterium]|nr:histidinol-phosphate transaminase [Lachnospiraceae bacterium]
MGSWEDNVRKVVPYVPGEQPNQPDMIKLNTNENPYPPAPGVQKILSAMDAGQMRLYPDPAAADLVQALADRYQVSPSQIFIGVGSDDVISMAFLTFFHGKKPVLFPDITYSFYEVWADVYRIPYRTIPLDDHFRICPEDYTEENGGIIFPNPNAPTGAAMEPDGVEQIIRQNPDSVVIVDEAYVDFGTPTALPLLKKYDNLLVVQTFSKSRSMAGMRIGFAIGNEKLIRFMQDVKYSVNSYTMNRPSILLGKAALQDDIYFRNTTGKIIDTREWAKDELQKRGFHFADSRANFIFASHETVPAVKIFEDLRKRHIYVRYFNRPRIDNYLRITIGTKEQMQALFDALDEILR